MTAATTVPRRTWVYTPPPKWHSVLFLSVALVGFAFGTLILWMSQHGNL